MATSLHTLLPTEGISSCYPAELSPFFERALRKRLPELFWVMVAPKPKEETEVPTNSILL